MAVKQAEMDQDTLDQLLSIVKRFVREKLMPLEEYVEENDDIPTDLIEEMKALGLFGLSIPESYGGLGLNMIEEAIVMQEIGYTSPAFRSVFATNVGIGSQGILIDGTDAQKEKFLPKLASGEYIGSFALTEPDAGSDAASVQTSAKRDGDFYVLNGTKRYITNAPRAGLFTVMARTGTTEERAGGVSAFIVESKSDGITLGKTDKKMGQRGTKTCDVIFEDVRVPAENLIGGREGQGFKTAMKVLDRGRLHMAAVATGTAKRLIDESVRYASEREQFGQPIANFQLVQAMLADSQTEYLAAKAMTEAARNLDAGQDIKMEASCCKLFATEMVGRVADRAVQVHGGAGYISEYAVEHFYRDVRLFRLYEGTSQIQQIIIAKEMLKSMGAS